VGRTGSVRRNAMSARAPQRRLLREMPPWVKTDATYFITICCFPRGLDQLCNLGISTALFESVEFRQTRGDSHMRLLVLTPDHLHAFVSFPSLLSPHKVITDWKSLLARRLEISWQRDFFEHRLRVDESLDFKATYIRQNPVRAGLVAKAVEWPYTWEPNLGGPGRSTPPTSLR